MDQAFKINKPIKCEVKAEVELLPNCYEPALINVHYGDHTKEEFNSAEWDTQDLDGSPNQSPEIQIKPEASDQEYPNKGNNVIFIKQELLHEDLDIKTEIINNSDAETMQDHSEDESVSKLGQKFNLNHHKGAKPFKCNLCDFESAWKNGLMYHKRFHNGEKILKCDLCDYKTAQYHIFQDHIKTHSKERPFSCNLCDFNSAVKSCLKLHMRTHSGEKPFKCTYCHYKSTQRYNLSNHMRIHTGETPFKCSLCRYKCALKTTLNRHIKTHSARKPQ